MIELTRTHNRIIELEALDWPERKIRRYLGYRLDSDWLAAKAHIRRFEQQREFGNAAAAGLSGVEARIFRFLVDNPHWRYVAEIAQAVGVSKADAREALEILQSEKLAQKTVDKGKGTVFWGAA